MKRRYQIGGTFAANICDILTGRSRRTVSRAQRRKAGGLGEGARFGKGPHTRRGACGHPRAASERMKRPTIPAGDRLIRFREMAQSKKSRRKRRARQPTSSEQSHQAPDYPGGAILTSPATCCHRPHVIFDMWKKATARAMPRAHDQCKTGRHTSAGTPAPSEVVG
jgi:hypothetical protein